MAIISRPCRPPVCSQGLAVLTLSGSPWPSFLLLRLNYDGDLAVQICHKIPSSGVLVDPTPTLRALEEKPRPRLNLVVKHNPHLPRVSPTL